MKTGEAGNGPVCAGFTLVELVTVIVILGILAAVVLPRLGGVEVYGERASSDRLVSGLRYAQQQALSRNRFVRVQIGQPRPARFRLHYCSADVPDPASCPDWNVLSPPTKEQGFWELAGGLQFASSPPTIYFDALGRSVDGSGSVDGPTPIPLEGGDVTITVEGETGFAHGA